jgi:hypothetical protein
MSQIFFFHIPKAGGISVQRAMQRSLPAATLSPIFVNNVDQHRKLAGNYAPYRGYDIYSGHYGREVYEGVRQNHLCITNFRHPVDRLISLYNYFRYMVPVDSTDLGDGARRPIELARSATFEEFVLSTDPMTEIYVCNAHYRLLSKNMWSLDEVSSVPEMCDFIDSMPCYYVCEFPGLSRLWLQTALGIGGIAVENATSGGDLVKSDSLDRSVVDRVCERNALDLALYRHAVERLLRLRFRTEA